MVRRQIAAIDAAAAAGIRHVVKISVWRAAPGRLLAEGAHGEIERHLAASGLAATVLQPNAFMQNFVTGAGAFTADGDLVGAYGHGRISYVDCADIAACAATVLTDPARRGGTHVLTGPAALSHEEIAAEISAVTGRTVSYVDMAPAEMAAALRAHGLPERFSADVAALAADVAAGALAGTTPAVRELTGFPPRTFSQFLADHALALRQAMSGAAS
ncbi:NmrA-like family protein [Pseudonocardia hierapolitana]|uniref:NmrA-like family protein n=2 Tax=Pseudonocardia hierapolitana TaxID=1128676 RepID=A0A561SZM6_9PSEU|nr:NmrA-like family protein [Pseudonocardia hierapolitana]